MSDPQEDTRYRLLNAAGEEFASKGFEAATIRSIIKRAGANIAAVNYYFASKDVLYTEAVLEAHRCTMQAAGEPDLGDGDPVELLREHVRFFLSYVLAVGRRDSWHHSLILREMLAPTHASEKLVKTLIRPRFERHAKIIKRLRPDLEGRELQAAVFSLVGQCLFYKMARPMAEELVGKGAFRALDVDFLTDHITGVMLRALGVEPSATAAAAGKRGEGRG